MWKSYLFKNCKNSFVVGKSLDVFYNYDKLLTLLLLYITEYLALYKKKIITLQYSIHDRISSTEHK